MGYRSEQHRWSMYHLVSSRIEDNQAEEANATGTATARRDDTEGGWEETLTPRALPAVAASPSAGTNMEEKRHQV